MEDNDVVVTGMGAITPLGGDVESLWTGMIEGRSGVRSIESDLMAEMELPVTIAAPMAVSPADFLNPVRAKRLDRSQQAALVAAREAWTDAGNPEVEPSRLAVVIGSGVGGILSLLSEDDVLERSGARRVSPRTVPMLMTNGAAALVSIEFGAQAGAYSPVSACASGAEAIAAGARLIRAGEADVVIAGGTEAAITPITLAAFAQIGALSKRVGDPECASRPFDRDRDGFVLGEGAGVLILERADHARARGKRARSVLKGAGIASDAFHMTSPDPEGAGQSSAITKALRQAGLHGRDIGHVNCHATGTAIGDLAEAKSIHRTLGPTPVLTAPKASLGHLVGAAGAVEAIVTVLSVQKGLIPPTRNLENVSPGIDFDIVSGSARSGPIEAAITNSFGFGGQNVSLLFTRR